MLVIAFTGFKGGLMLPTFDFLALTKLTQYSRILLLDTARTCYLGGIPPLFDSYGALLSHLRQSIATLAPSKIICIGASSGAFGALLLGRELGADYVHAFSPYTYLDHANAERHQDPDATGNQGRSLHPHSRRAEGGCWPTMALGRRGFSPDSQRAAPECGDIGAIAES